MKRIFIISLIIMMLTPTVLHAEMIDVNYNVNSVISNSYFIYNDTVIRINDNKIRYFWWTGKEFLLYDTKTHTLNSSKDSTNWETTNVNNDLIYKISCLYKPVIRFVGDRYVAYDMYYGDPSADPIIRGNELFINSTYVMDSDFNLIDSYKLSEPITDFEYINGVYYLETSEYYRDENNNLNRKSKIYTSDDAINWIVDETLIEIPKYNGKNFMTLSNKLVNYTSGLYRFEWDNIKISNNNSDGISIEFEKQPKCQCIVVDDLYIAYQKDKSKSFMVSLDGIYFFEVGFPDYSGVLCDCNWWKNKLVFRTTDKLIEYDIAELRSALKAKCPLDTPYIKLKDNILGFETPPVIEDGSTLVPMRFLFEQMGADVEWNGETQTATATLDTTAVTFAIDDTNTEVNNTPAIMDVPARLINGKTMVPLRFLSENMGYTVDWDAESRTAIIN